jgi:2,4-dienoyl-CoA reductase (NADPH2)
MRLLLTPLDIGTCSLRNRFVMTAANLSWCTDGFVTDKFISFHQDRARGHVGLTIAGAAGIDPVRINRASMMGIYDDKFIPGLQRLTDAVHQENTRIFVQLMHPGAYARRREYNNATAVAPSAHVSRFTGEEARELSIPEIQEIIGWYGDAAVRAKKAGFDGIEILASAGYLIAEFLSPAINVRRDRYGGSLRNRAEFLMEILQEVRRRTGTEFPISVRLAGADFIPGGNTVEETVEIARLIEPWTDVYNITGGWHETPVPQITANVPHGTYLYLASAVKKAVDKPVIGCNRIDIETAETAISQRFCDLVGICRGFIADPELALKYEKDRADTVRPCIACNQECMDRIFSGSELRCAINPEVGREHRTSDLAIRGEKILVIGAGITGLAYAGKAASGNQVTVWEKSTAFGGSGRLVARVPGHRDVRLYLDYLWRNCLRNQVKFEFGKTATGSQLCRLLRNREFDRIVIATGSEIRGIAYPHSRSTAIITANECIAADRLPFQKIAVLGAGFRAVQTALYLRSLETPHEEALRFLKTWAPEQLPPAKRFYEDAPRQITMIAGKARPGGGFGKSIRWMVPAALRQADVHLEMSAEDIRIGRQHVEFSRNGEKHSVPADLVVLASGWIPSRDLYYPCQKAFPGRVELIGDAVRPARITDAVRDVYMALTETTGRDALTNDIATKGEPHNEQ